MHSAIISFIACIFTISQVWSEEKPAATAPAKGIFVGAAENQEDCPYRYFLVREQGRWSGEVEFCQGDQSIFFGKLDVISSKEDKIVFTAPIGRPGKILLSGWELSLAPTEYGYRGTLFLLKDDGTKDAGAVDLKFVAKPDAVMPSSEMDEKLLALDTLAYRSEETLRHELVIAKKGWEAESAIEEGIAVLRGDDTLRKGIRREWTGPLWVKDRIKPEESKYFERICIIYLGGTKITDEEVRRICSLKDLRELFLHSTGITDAALAEIGQLESLRLLHLANTRISDQGLEKLRSLTTLQELYLNGTSVTDEGGGRLKEQLPNTVIHR